MDEKFKNRVILVFWITAAIILFFVFRNVIAKVNQRKDHPTYVIGFITGKHTGAKGIRYLDFTFNVDGKVYNNVVPIDFCEGCSNNCCAVGTKVKVRYAAGDPTNCDLVH